MEQWTGETGLISNNLTSVAQTSDGFLWITTFNGVHRFDGNRFLLYDKENVPVLSTNAIYSIMEDQDTLYFSTQGSGLITLHNQQFSRLSVSEVYSIRKTIKDSRGRLWIATNNEGVYFQKNNESKKLEHPALEQVIIPDIIEDESQNIWIGTGGNGILRYSDNGKSDHFTSQDGLPDNYISSFLLDSTGKIYAGTQKGLVVWNGEHFESVENTTTYEINDIIEGPEGYIWCGTEQGLLRIRPEDHYFELHNESRGLPANQVSSLTFDHEGTLWISTKKAGLISFKTGSITNITDLDGLAYPRVNIVSQKNSEYYIGCDNGSITIFSGKDVNTLELETFEKGVGIRDFAFEEDGTLWVASYLGLIRYKNGKSIKYNSENGLNSNSIRRVLKADDGSLWLASKTGGVIHMMDNEQFEFFHTGNSLQSNYILAVEQDLNGDIVVGTHSGGISIIRNDTVETHRIPGLTGTLFFNVTIDHENNYWLSTNTGLFLFKDGKFRKLEIEAGFKTETFFDLILDDSGNAWTTSTLGIIRLNGSELAEFADGKREILTAEIFDKKDGMVTRECTGATRSLKTSTGQVWIPTIEGVAIIDPNAIRENLVKPNVVITSFTIDGERLPEEKEVEPGHIRYSLEFAALSFVASNKNLFKYKLDGFDRDWITSRTPEVEYTNLGPGKYTFRVMASNNNGVWNEEGASVSFVVEPFYYQTIWFYIALAALLGTMIYLGFLWRISKVKEMNTKLVKVNEELDRFVYSASHDLRAPLTSVQGLVELSKYESSLEGKDEYLNMIGQSVRKLDNFIKDIIDYSRNQRQEVVYDRIEIVSEIEQVINQLKYLDLDNRVDIHISSNTDEIVTDRRRLTVILKNLISNALMYYDPQKEESYINVSVSLNKMIHISIEDNGQGISRDHLPNIFKMFYRAREDSKGSGLGLYIVKEALDKINGQIRVDSSLGKGTRFLIEIPASPN
jgi:signal transduction histidine kinase/ligand-binding sensor domain-containing protein